MIARNFSVLEMDIPTSVFRQQQRWAPPNRIESAATSRLVAFNNCEHDPISYSHLRLNPMSTRQRSHLVSLKSKIGVEFRRYAVPRDKINKFEDFFRIIQDMHQLTNTPFLIYYSDQDGEMLPINNDDNLAKAIDTASCLETAHQLVAGSNKLGHICRNQSYSQSYNVNNYVQKVIIERPLLKLFLVKAGIANDLDLTLKCKRKDNLINLLMSINSTENRPLISMPEDFRQVSSIIDADILPVTRRRVVLKRGSSDKPLGFYIRDGTYHRMNSRGIIEKSYGIFISRLVPGGLAESTNLLAENDEILEVNGIQVGKNQRLDQVRDMMVENSSNLILTTRPAKPVNNMSRTYNNNYRLPTQFDSNNFGEEFDRHNIN